MEATANGDETEEQSEHIRIFDHIIYSSESVICNLEQMTEVSYPLRAVNIVNKKTLEESICVKRSETSYGVLTVTLCGESAVSKNLFVFRRGVKFVEIVVNVSLVNGRYRFAPFPELRAAGTPYPAKKGPADVLVRRRDGKVMSSRECIL